MTKHVITLIGGPLNGQKLKVENKPKILPIRCTTSKKIAIYNRFDSRTYKYQEPKPSILSLIEET